MTKDGAMNVTQATAREMMAQHLNGGGHDSFDFLQLWSLFLKHRWFVFLITLLTTIFAGLYAMRIPDMFEASALIQLSNQNKSVFGGDSSGSLLSSRFSLADT